MPNFLLTKSSIILCPHGGMVTHFPMSYSGELINGEVPMLLNDIYFIASCVNGLSDIVIACHRVMWVTASISKLIGGIPVLINTSVGICHSASGIPVGPPLIASFQTVVID